MKLKIFFIMILLAAATGIGWYYYQNKTTTSNNIDRTPIVTSTTIIDYTVQPASTTSDLQNPASTASITTTVLEASPKTITVMLSGLYGCLPVRDEFAADPNNSCELGLFTNNGDYYALDTSILEAKKTDTYPTGTLLNISGVFTPIEQMDSSTWSKYQIKGMVKVMEATETE